MASDLFRRHSGPARGLVEGDWLLTSDDIKINGRSTYLGRFTDEVDAARAYDEAAITAWGEFAHLNFPGR